MGANKNFFTIERFSGPLHIIWDFTYSCNCSCKYCYNSPVRGNHITKWKELNSQDILRLTKEVARLFPIKLTFSGGEPLERKELLFEVVRIVKKIRPQTHVGMMTNGMLIEETDTRFIKDNFSYVAFNIDGATKEAHERIKGRTASFEQITENIKSLAKERRGGLAIGISFMPLRENFNELENVVELASAIGADSVSVLELLRIGKAVLHPDLFLGKEERQKVIEKVAAMKRKHKQLKIGFVDPSIYIRQIKDLSAPNQDLYIRADGTTGVLPFLPIDGPNIKEGELKYLWDRYFADFWKNLEVKEILKTFTTVNEFSPRAFCDAHICLEELESEAR